MTSAAAEVRVASEAGFNGAVSREELNHAQTQLNAARSTLAAAQAAVVGAREQLASNQAMTSGTNVDRR